MELSQAYIRYLLLITAVCVNIANCDGSAGAGRYWTPAPYVGRRSMSCRKTSNPMRLRAQAMSQFSSYITEGCNNCEQQCMSNCGRPFTDRCQHEEHILSLHYAAPNEVQVAINFERETFILPVRLILVSHVAIRYKVYVPEKVTIDHIVLASFVSGSTVQVYSSVSNDYDQSNDELHGVKVYQIKPSSSNNYPTLVSELDLNCVLSYTRRHAVSSWSLSVGVANGDMQRCSGTTCNQEHDYMEVLPPPYYEIPENNVHTSALPIKTTS